MNIVGSTTARRATTSTTTSTTKLSALGFSDYHLLTTTKYDMINNIKQGYNNNNNYYKQKNLNIIGL